MALKVPTAIVEDIRTAEGVAEWAVGLAAAALTATGDLSVSKGLVYASIATVVKSVRQVLTAITVGQKVLGVEAPIQPKPLQDEFSVGAILTDIGRGVEDAKAAQEAPGVPAESIVAGLAPETPVAVPVPTPPVQA